MKLPAEHCCTFVPYAMDIGDAEPTGLLSSPCELAPPAAPKKGALIQLEMLSRKLHTLQTLPVGIAPHCLGKENLDNSMVWMTIVDNLFEHQKELSCVSIVTGNWSQTVG